MIATTGTMHLLGQPLTAILNLYGVGLSLNLSSMMLHISVVSMSPLPQFSLPGQASVALTSGPSEPVTRPMEMG